MKRFILILTTLATLGCLHQQPRFALPIPPVQGDERTAFALRYIEIVEGTGAPLVAGKCVFAHYTGWLTDGKKFDSSRDTTRSGAPGQPLSFPLGARRVIAGWDFGFDGMRVGGQRRLIIPYQLAYGERGRPPIPPKATLIFDVELMGVADTVPRTIMPGAPPPTAPQCPPWAQVKAR